VSSAEEIFACIFHNALYKNCILGETLINFFLLVNDTEVCEVFSVGDAEQFARGTV
jgi:hypothetical protein